MKNLKSASPFQNFRIDFFSQINDFLFQCSIYKTHMPYIIGKVFGCGLADFETSLMIYERKFKFYTRALSKTDLVRTWGQSPF
jgi:hypothetical protein